MILYSIIKDGQFHFTERTLPDFLRANEGKKFVHDVSEDKPKRTLNQNALYWSYLTLIEQETGQPANDLHKIAKGLFLAPRQVTMFGESYRVSASTTKLSKHEFSDYLDRISAWSGVPVPDTESFNRATGKVDYPEHTKTAFD